VIASRCHMSHSSAKYSNIKQHVSCQVSKLFIAKAASYLVFGECKLQLSFLKNLDWLAVFKIYYNIVIDSTISNSI